MNAANNSLANTRPVTANTTPENISREQPLVAGRRKFLQQMGASAVLLATVKWSGETPGASMDAASPTEESSTADSWAILIDTTRCTGCQSCAVACQAVNKLPLTATPPTALDANAYSFVDVRQVSTPDQGEAAAYVKRQCMHCLHPACASACTVGALHKTAAGPVVYDADKCIGCRYCQYACPFGVPAYAWGETLGLISKCQMCAARLQVGQAPACTLACPNGALRFGPRRELLAQAHGQIASNPARYVDHVYGEFEAGGTSVLYLAAVPFAQLGFPTLANDAAPAQAEAIMRNTPVVALTVAALATSLYWLTRRRNEQLEHEAVEPPHETQTRQA